MPIKNKSHYFSFLLLEIPPNSFLPFRLLVQINTNNCFQTICIRFNLLEKPTKLAFAMERIYFFGFIRFETTYGPITSRRSLFKVVNLIGKFNASTRAPSDLLGADWHFRKLTSLQRNALLCCCFLTVGRRMHLFLFKYISYLCDIPRQNYKCPSQSREFLCRFNAL